MWGKLKTVKTSEELSTLVDQFESFCAFSMEKVKKELLTSEILLKIVRKATSPEDYFEDCILKGVPNKIITKEIAELAIERNGKDLKYTPHKFRSKELCIKALNRESATKANIKNVPKHLRTEEIYLALTSNNNAYALRGVPLDFSEDPEFIAKVVKQNRKYINIDRSHTLAPFGRLRDWALYKFQNPKGTYSQYQTLVENKEKAVEDLATKKDAHRRMIDTYNFNNGIRQVHFFGEEAPVHLCTDCSTYLIQEVKKVPLSIKVLEPDSSCTSKGIYFSTKPKCFECGKEKSKDYDNKLLMKRI